jgi:hypothetical protein
MGHRFLGGRDFTAGDRQASVPVAIVNETLSRRHWPDAGAIGRRIIFPGTDDVTTPLTIVGVVADARQRGLTTPPGDEIYLPLAQRPSASDRSGMTLVARTTGPAATLLPAMQQAVWNGDPRAAVYEGLTMTEVMDREVWRERLASDLVAAFAVLALVLAALGIQGVVSYAASRRMREFGIRLALGAAPAGISRLALTEAVAPVVGGLVVGCILALAVTRLMSSLLVGVSAHDPVVIAATIGLLVVTGLGAAWFPASRAARRDPMETLRDS